MKKLFVIPFGLPYTWSADYEKQTALYISKQHIVIEFLIGEGISVVKYIARPAALWKRTGPSRYIFRPLYILPFQRYAAMRSVNYFLTVLQLKLIIQLYRSLRNTKKYLYSFSLQESARPSWFGRSYTQIYDCMDAFISTDIRTDDRWKKIDASLTDHAHIVFTVSKALYDLKKKQHPLVHFLPVGFDEKTMKLMLHASEPRAIRSIPHPRVCLVGNLSSRLDFPFIYRLARATPDYSYILLGKIDYKYITFPAKELSSEVAKIEKLSNIYFLGPRSRKKVAQILQHIDVGLIPYDMKEPFTKYSFPMKLWEYFYYGKPVLATNNKELHPYSPFVMTANNSADALPLVHHLVAATWSKTQKTAMKTIAIQNSWNNRTKKILAHISKYETEKGVR